MTSKFVNNNEAAISSISDLYALPDNLPVPKDDGGCDHLYGLKLPEVKLVSTNGDIIDLSKLDVLVVIYCYPRSGKPGTALPDGWDDIPGARGCTPQACTFRDLNVEFNECGAQLFGVSTQTTEDQHEFATRLHLPFTLLSDDNLFFTKALNLPTHQVHGMTLIKRLTLVVDKGIIKKVFYPIFPPTLNAQEALKFIKSDIAIVCETQQQELKLVQNDIKKSFKDKSIATEFLKTRKGDFDDN